MFGSKTKINIEVDGMSCQHCAKSVKNALENLSGVVKAEIDLEKKLAVATLKKAGIPREIINKAIQDAGYKIISINE